LHDEDPDDGLGDWNEYDHFGIPDDLPDDLREELLRDLRT